MTIRDLTVLGMRGATSPGGWARELRPIHLVPSPPATDLFHYLTERVSFET